MKSKVFKKRLDQNVVSDILVIISFLILFFTTLTINVHGAMYLLAAEIFVLSNVVNRIR